MSDLAIYDMDRTVTKRATYTPFLLHCALRRAPWRLLLVPFVVLSMLAYVLRLIDLNVRSTVHRIGNFTHPRSPSGRRMIVRSQPAFASTHS